MAERGRRALHIDPEDRRPSSGPSQNRRNGAGRTPRPRWGWRLTRWGLLAGLWAAILTAGVLGYFALTLPPVADLMTAQRRPSVTLLGTDGSVIATVGDLFGQPLRLKDLPPYVPEAVIATEDRRFYHHFGLDPVGLARALYVNLRAGHVVQGGSTITQQLAKNLFLTPERTLPRKIQEALLALWLEHKFTKDQLLEIYLNRVYLGAGTYGVDAAAERYFDKSARDATLYEAAAIAGLLKAPTRFSPANDRARAEQRTAQVLANMVAAGYITPAQLAAAQAQKSELALAGRIKPGSRYFADWVYEQSTAYAGQEGAGRDLLVLTTLDPRLQAAAEAAVSATLSRDGEKADVEQAALVAMSPDGAIRAMVGGRNYGESQFNRVTQAQRQPGSAFKPFVYLAALEHGLSPTDHFVDQPIRIGDWQPHNYEGTYRGEITVSDALAHSVNTVAAEVLQRVGVDNVIAAAHRLGITAELSRDPSLALGTSEVSLIDLTSAYCAFASGGVGALPYGIFEIRDRDGAVLYKRHGDGGARVISPEVAGMMNDMLSEVMTRGTGRAAALNRPAAGKTGTTQDFRDAWFVGYTADLVTGVWLGNDDNTPTKHVVGGTLPARTWHSFMVAASDGTAARPLPSAPQVALTGSSSGGWFSRLLHNIFGNDTHAAPQRRTPFVPRPNG
jgi:penicillin-binding protein 1A